MRVPIARMVSAPSSALRRAAVKNSGWVGGRQPRPAPLRKTGAWIRSARRRSGSAASHHQTADPARIEGSIGVEKVVEHVHRHLQEGWAWFAVQHLAKGDGGIFSQPRRLMDGA